MDNAQQAHELLHRISEPIEEISDSCVIDCIACDERRTFDDPADCPECAGSRYIVL